MSNFIIKKGNIDSKANADYITLPRLTQIEIDSLVNVNQGSFVFNITLNKIQTFNGLLWETLDNGVMNPNTIKLNNTNTNQYPINFNVTPNSLVGRDITGDITNYPITNFLLSNAPLGNILFVSASAPVINDSQTRTDALGRIDRPFRSIQSALNVSVTGDVVYVFSGTYIGNLSISSSVFNFQHTKLVLSNNVIINGNINFVGNGALYSIIAENYLCATINGNFGISAGTYMMLFLNNLVWNGNIVGDVRTASWKNNWITTTSPQSWTRGGNESLELLNYKSEIIGNTIYGNQISISLVRTEDNYFEGTSTQPILNIGQNTSFKNNIVINLGTGVSLRSDSNILPKIIRCDFKSNGNNAIFIAGQNDFIFTPTFSYCNFQSNAFAITGTPNNRICNFLNINCISNVPFLQRPLGNGNFIDVPINQAIESTFAIN